MRAAVASVASQLGVSAKGATILHMANNAVFALPEAGLVVRVTRSNRLHDRVRKVARLGAWFAAIDAPTIRLAGAASHPLAFDDLLATVWEYVPAAAPPDIDDLARALREFHSLPVPEFGLERWDPVAVARNRIADAQALEDDDRKVLLDWCDRLEPEVDALVEGSAHAVVHGDAHVGNLLRRPDGRVVFCDFDSTCLGPPGVDLSAVAASELWFKGDGRHARLAASYGQDSRGLTETGNGSGQD